MSQQCLRWRLPALLGACLAPAAWGFQVYADEVPNGGQVMVGGALCLGFGHATCSGGGVNSQFGLDFKSNGYQWSFALCNKDSFGVGISNARLFGDPNCAWRKGQTPLRGFGQDPVGAVVVLTASDDSLKPKKDAGVLVLIAAVFLLGLVGSVAARTGSVSLTKTLFNPGPMNWTLANGLGVFAVVAGLIVFTGGLSKELDNFNVTKILGLATALAASLPIWWSSMKVGVHQILGMSREAAWRIHIVFGDIMLIFGTVHGIFAFSTPHAVFDSKSYTLGFVGLLLMFVGVLGTPLPHLGLITYDRWKSLHFLSVAGYLLAFTHICMQAQMWQTASTIAVAVLNGLALACGVVQNMLVSATFYTAEVVSSEVSKETDGQHVSLLLKVPGFSYRAGQWAHVRIPSISNVAHPFTIVPGGRNTVAPAEIRFHMKVSGKFTAQLAEKLQSSGSELRVQIQGPYGSPPVPSNVADSTVFVLGGVGVTPALSLVPAAKVVGRASHLPVNARTRVYWSCRSPALLRDSAALLGPEVDRNIDCIRYTGSGTPELPPFCSTGRQDLGDWLAKVGPELAAAGAKSVLLFVCGPASLVTAAKNAAAKAEGVTWMLHVEEFLFLPNMGPQKAPKGKAGSQQGGQLIGVPAP